jgi:nitroreductase/dihydropteridine reductase
MEFKEIVMSRYATKKFDNRKVPEEKIRQLLELVRFAPSALNLQPWKINVVTDQGIREELKPVTWNQEQITTCSHLLVFCANPDFATLIVKLDKLMEKNKVPDDARRMVIALATDLTGKMTPEQKLAYAQSHVFLALGNAVNGAKALGFDSCPMGGFDPQAYGRILRLPGNLVPTMLCPVGYAADRPMPKIRFAYDDIVF